MNRNYYVDWYTIRDLKINADVYGTCNRTDAVKWLLKRDNLERYSVNVLKYEPRESYVSANEFVQEEDKR